MPFYIFYPLYVFICAVKRLIVINRIQNKVFVYIIYVCALCIFIMYIKIHKHAYIYLRKICYVYKLSIFIYNLTYMNKNYIHVNICIFFFKI